MLNSVSVFLICLTTCLALAFIAYFGINSILLFSTPIQTVDFTDFQWLILVSIAWVITLTAILGTRKR